MTDFCQGLPPWASAPPWRASRAPPKRVRALGPSYGGAAKRAGPPKRAAESAAESTAESTAVAAEEVAAAGSRGSLQWGVQAHWQPCST
mmetsp:Transcript_67487/g.152718  ORF Transcript_67487/g.152718 Transcript_67487/m.152718 type:complete len:89 (+) Transcript_67487:97-363(+)